MHGPAVAGFDCKNICMIAKIRFPSMDWVLQLLTGPSKVPQCRAVGGPLRGVSHMLYKKLIKISRAHSPRSILATEFFYIVGLVPKAVCLNC